ncbi:MAG: type II toxin-antitoxin system HicA family toxin [bacterium]
MRRVPGGEVESLLKRHGFELISQKGSHRKWRHPDTGRQIIVPEHRGRQLPMGTLRNILINARTPEEEWRAE